MNINATITTEQYDIRRDLRLIFQHKNFKFFFFFNKHARKNGIKRYFIIVKL